MSSKISVPAKVWRFGAAFAFGAAAAAACMGACAIVIARHGLPNAVVWPLATFSVCVGSLLGGWLFAILQKHRGLVCGAAFGAAFAAVTLLAQGFSGSAPDYTQILRAILITLAGAAGGLIYTLAATKAKKRR